MPLYDDAAAEALLVMVDGDRLASRHSGYAFVEDDARRVLSHLGICLDERTRMPRTYELTSRCGRITRNPTHGAERKLIGP